MDSNSLSSIFEIYSIANYLDSDLSWIMKSKRKLKKKNAFLLSGDTKLNQLLSFVLESGTRRLYGLTLEEFMWMNECVSERVSVWVWVCDWVYEWLESDSFKGKSSNLISAPLATLLFM